MNDHIPFEHNVGRSMIVSSAIIAIAMVAAATVYAYMPGGFPENSQTVNAEQVQNANNTGLFTPTGGGCTQ